MSDTAFCIMLIAEGLLLVAFAVTLIRNHWVFKQRCKLHGTAEYDRLPSYQAMMRRWWVWDIKKFL